MKCPQCQHDLRVAARFCDNCGLPIPFLDASTIHQSGDVIADPLIGRILDSKYELLAKLGEGGMGAVYRARRVHLAGEVAIKVLNKKYVVENGAVERFRREARAASQLNHPNVVTIHDFGESHGDDVPAYIVMELVEGESLRVLIRREGLLSPERAIALMRNICAGVGAAHRRNIIHRDLKPDNIIILPPNEDRELELAKVVDFGLAKLRDMVVGNTLTRTGALIGTPYYMSPEQCRGEMLDARADVYSLGAMLYEMLAGVPPFIADNLADLVAKHLYEEPPVLPKYLNVSREVQSAYLRALSKQPITRQADATELSRELKNVEEYAEAQRVTEEQRKIEVERQVGEKDAQHLIEGSRLKNGEELRLKDPHAESNQQSGMVLQGEIEGQQHTTITIPTSVQSQRDSARIRWAIGSAIALAVVVAGGIAYIKIGASNPNSSTSQTQSAQSSTYDTESDVERYMRLKRLVDLAPASEAARMSAEMKGQPLSSSDPEFLYLYGRALLLSGRYISALDAFDQASKITPKESSSAYDLLKADLLNTKVATALRTGDNNRAREAARDVKSYAEVNQEKFYEEVQRMRGDQSGRPSDSDDPLFLYNFGKALLFSGSYKRAMVAFETAIKEAEKNLTPRNAEIIIDSKIALAAAALSADDVNAAVNSAQGLDVVIRSRRLNE